MKNGREKKQGVQLGGWGRFLERDRDLDQSGLLLF
jgi:hypothetical protein